MNRKLSTRDLESYAKLLRQMLASIHGDITCLEQEALGNGDGRADTQGDDGADYSLEFSLELLEHDESTVRAIEDALDRIATGTYGRCETCDEWIVRERLKAMPHARNCIDCQRQEERSR